MSTDQFESVLKDKFLADEIRKRLMPTHGKKEETGFESVGGFESLAGAEPPVIDRGYEAIVRRFGRPSLLVKNGTFEVPESDTWKARLYPTMNRLEKSIRSVGRIDLVNHSSQHVGSAWLIADDIVVTNRHVADLFAQKDDNGYSFRHNPLNDEYGAAVHFKEDNFQLDGRQIDVQDILYVADNRDGQPDLAFLKLKNDGSFPMPPPIKIYSERLSIGQMVAVIGYPAYDDRNDASDMNRIFGSSYGVKRFAPGEVQDVYTESFTHDCTTLGGNSGSIVVDVLTGEAVGLHFAGEYLKANFAVSAGILNEFLTDKIKAGKVSVPVAGDSATPQSAAPAPDYTPAVSLIERPKPKIEELADRTGYDSGFLGDTADLIVPLPTLTDQIKDQAAVIDGAPEGENHVLKYTNYSAVMNRVRRLAFYTATNIDGSQAKRIKRKGDNWFFDVRIPEEAQVGHDLYKGSDFHRGHLTRRLDPVWGEQSKLAEGDTFFFTNCSPQHRNFNTKTWLELEDFLLDSINTRGFKATLFTGPVFGDNDRPFEFKTKDGRDSLLIPIQYWKVVVMVNEATNKLSATAYIISQKDLISNLESVFGQFKTYQIPIAKIENLTRLDFGNLKSFDPLGKTESVMVRELDGPEGIVL